MGGIERYELVFMDILARLRHLAPADMANRIRNLAVDVMSHMSQFPRAARPEGVSVLMRVKNEEWWIRPSILSLQGLADEWIIVDGSTDRTPEIIDSLRSDMGLNIIHIRDQGEDIVEISNKALAQARYRWILRWDGDFVAREEMTKFIGRLTQSLDPRMYYVIYWPHICLDGDVFHQDPRSPLHWEHWLVTWTPGIRFVKVSHGCEYLYVPTHLSKRIHIDRPLSFHLRTVKPAERILLRKYWGEMFERELLGRVPLETYAKERMLSDYGTDSLEEAGRRLLEELVRGLRVYPRDEFGDYPQVLKEEVLSRWGLDVDSISMNTLRKDHLLFVDKRSTETET